MAERTGNLVSLAAIQAFRMAAGVAVNVLVMRQVGVAGFGVYGTVTTLVALGSFGAGMGLDRLLKREMARDPARSGHYVATGLGAVGLLAVGTTSIIVVSATLLDGRPLVVVAAFLAALAMALQSLAVVPVSYFHAVRRMGLGIHGNLLGRAALVFGTAVFLWQDWGILAVFAAQIVDGGVTLAVVWATWRAIPDRGTLATSWREVRALVGESVPFGLNAFFGTLYLMADVLLLAAFRDDAEVGIYRGAVMLISLFPIVADTLSNGLYPRMARHLGEPGKAGGELRFAARVLLAVSVPAAVGAMLTAEPLIIFIGGSAFAGSALPFMVMAPLLPLRFLNNGYGMTLSALDRQGDRTRGVFCAAALNIALNLVAIPRWGAMGAAVTTLATEIFLSLWMSWRVRPLVVGLDLGSSVVRVALAAAGMGVGVWLLPDLHVLVTIGVGVALYAGAALATGAIRRGDLRQLRAV